MSLSSYRFVSRWHVSADREAVYDVLLDLGSYPQWWPQVRSVEQYNGQSATVVVRSFLPYSLRILTVSRREDCAAGVLEAGLEGDMEGWSRWTLSPTDDGCALLYEQQVAVLRPLLRRLGLLARPFFRLNHAVMMRAGERGLRHRLSG
ncbi:MAG: SRPBCC family protein [Nocardioidaceae bacterium]|nr:SRPBCC family protein [Nocardioidaceae bacterium]